MGYLASGDLRNLIMTVNNLPHDYVGQLTVVLNDRERFVVLRNILLLSVLGTIPDKRRAADVALHLWYSAFVPQDYHGDFLSLAAPLAMGLGPLDTKLGDNARLRADIDHDMRMLCAALGTSSRVYGMSDAANELGGVR